ncbi:MAG: SUMF1/EgtB/PvdO family nonheme iron enzyme, partial [Myxococcota bacterium]|nr:SUMF1/EgtB/PvdO family nonheme iron enzyme [Myxococcota bacterium]
GDGCGTGDTMPVCSKPLGNTDNGLCDMVGNLWEWTLDWYHDSYMGAPTDGSPWVEPRGETRTMRGGAYTYDAFWNRTTARDSHGDPAFQVPTLGFRCVRGVDVDADYDAPIIEASVVGDFNDCGAGDCDFMCLADACANPDGNTHMGCACDADYCVPDESGVEFAGLTPLTCTTAHCDPDDPATCPTGTVCNVIPPFVLDMFAGNGVVMPPTLCGAP